MIEILILYNLTKRIGAMVEQKGYKSGGYKLTTVLLWFGGEIFGAIIGSLLTGGDEASRCLVYILALMGAGAGAGISYFIANNLTALAPGLTPTEAEQPILTSYIGQLPALVLWVLWLLANAVANIGWGLTYDLINPNYQESLYTIASIAAGGVAGFIVATLQTLLLALAIKSEKRLSLIIWIPVTVLGWGLSAAAFNFITISSDILFFFVYLAIGLMIGVLQWLVLQNYSRIAFWWILANAADWFLIWAMNQSSMLYNISSMIVYNFIAGIIGSMVTSIAIVFILRNVRTPAADDM